ncbi:MAG: histidine phosphatase family protein [Candidatus Eremiobacteraeota bacterium]|nr:histidine phosphatase family protein [Candidatus Eremiobacteraeota bacterium]
MKEVQKKALVTTICMVRHGETDWNRERKFQGREDTELNEAGKKQASEIAAHLAGFSWDVIIASPLKRAFVTADIIRLALEITPLLPDEAFIERDFGKSSGLTHQEQELAFPEGNVPGKESDDDLEKRVLEGLRGIMAGYGGKRVVLVTHGAVINSLLKAVSAGTIDVGETKIKNACLTIIEHDGSGWHVKAYNSVEHLAE